MSVPASIICRNTDFSRTISAHARILAADGVWLTRSTRYSVPPTWLAWLFAFSHSPMVMASNCWFF
jgi:hypothetical protein